MVNDTHVYMEESDTIRAGSGDMYTMLFFGETVTISMPRASAQLLADRLYDAGITPKKGKTNAGNEANAGSNQGATGK